MTDPRLDALELEHRAVQRGLPREIAAAIGALVARAALVPERRDEVLEELMAHFEDGLAAGRPATELLAEFGDADLRPPPPLPPPLPDVRRGDHLMSRLLRDLQYAGRRLLATPGFTLVAVLSLALGIGATTTVFSLVNAIVLRGSPIRAVEEVVDVYESGADADFNPFSYPDYKDFERGTTAVFSESFATKLTMAQVTRDGVPTRSMAELVTGGYFPLLGLRPTLGRLLGPEDDVAPGGHPVVVLGHGYWMRAFGGDRGVIGRTLPINGRAYEIVGVAPADYPGNVRGLEPDFYAPVMMVNHLLPSEVDQLQARGYHGTFVKARLRPGVTLAAATGVAAGVAAELRKTAPLDWSGGKSFALVPTRKVIVLPTMDRMLYPLSALLLTMVGLVLLVVCANLASFLLARAVDRRKEIAVRLALGATRGRLVSQLLTETLLLGILGGAGGLAVAMFLTRVLVSADLPLPIPITLDLEFDGRVLVFTTAVSLAAGLLFGLVPALRASNPHLATTLRDESAGGGGRGRMVLRHGLVVAQVAVSLVLLVAAGLFLRSLQSVRSVDPGFGREPAGLLQVIFPPARYPANQVLTAQRQLAERIGALPGVSAVGMIDNMPLNLINTQDTEINSPGVEPPAGQTGYSVDRAVVDTGFFSAAGIRLLAGRDFSALDTDSSGPVVIVNEALARRLWADGNAVGRRVTRSRGREYEVIGVVSTTRIRTLGEAPRPAVYLPLSQDRSSSVWYLARTGAGAEATAASMLRAAQAMDAEIIPIEARSMARHLEVVALPMRLGAVAIAALAALALTLAVIGLNAAVRYSVAQRTREVGIRLALGAESGAMVQLLVRGGLRLVAWGGAIGLVTALLLGRLMSRFLFGVPALDPVTFVTVPFLLLGAAGLAAWLPARRVTRVAPTEALRSEG